MNEHLKNGAAIFAGSAIMGFGINYFNTANGLAEGGITGVSLLLKYMFGWETGITNFLLNLPLFFIGWKVLGRRSFAYTVFATLMFSLFVYVFRNIHFVMNDLLLASLYAGVTVGVGLGIVFRFGGTSGGTDILAQVLKKYLGWPIGRSVFIFDSFTIILSLIYLDRERAMYTIVAVFVGSRLIDYVLEGTGKGKAAIIVSQHAEEISNRIHTELERGTTFFYGKGGYSDTDKKIIYCVVSRSEVGRLKKLVYATDRQAFVTLNDVFEVFGEGFNIMQEKA
ncbi:YitT family protein [Paenibacillus andongensis]|uniref:YitT family protein n=1 Tax=Paenibacillus andongensis TaxID=2975482 RepID=UPI0021BAFFE4|nr:YitT family protein [Paenibacillus andongensis]